MRPDPAGIRAAIERRRSEREALIDRARSFAQRLPAELDPVATIVFGSVARGDFNVWSDVDVLVIARNVPSGAAERYNAVMRALVPRVQPVVWTPEELEAEMARENPIAVEASEFGIDVLERAG